MIESVLQVLAYTGVGLAVLMAGFLMLDALTPGRLGHHIMQGNPGAGLLAASALVSLGLIQWFAIDEARTKLNAAYGAVLDALCARA